MEVHRCLFICHRVYPQEHTHQILFAQHALLHRIAYRFVKVDKVQMVRISNLCTIPSRSFMVHPVGGGKYDRPSGVIYFSPYVMALYE
jgi:hypothetical protein